MDLGRKASYGFLIALLGSAWAGGCAQDVGDIDRTQPNLLKKSMFEDNTWFFRQTVTDVPDTSTFSFVGETGEMELIRWEIQEDYLVAYRAYEKIPGSDPAADHEGAGVGTQPVADGLGTGRNPDEYKGQPIAAYPIQDHVDVIRDYNPRTGEQTNVISENSSDRPWYEREYIRVDWSRNLVANFMFISTAMNMWATNASYVQENEGGPDAFRKETDEDGKVNYFDFTERLWVEPDIYGCLFSLYYGEPGDCTGQEVNVRSSFLRVDPDRERDYVVQPYDDNRHGEFGYFRTERPTYDRRRGATWSGYIYLANRFDLWTNSKNADGTPKAYAERGLRPVVYALSPGYPADMKAITTEIATEWDEALKTTVEFLRGQTRAQLEADLQTQTGNTCMFCIDENADGHARIGDLRHNFLYWVDSPQMVSPLGYGPSSANPETGRIVAGMAYVYGAAVDTYAQYAKDLVDLLNGDLDEEDLRSGSWIRNEITTAGRRPNLHPEALERLRRFQGAEGVRAMLGEERFGRLQALVENGLPEARPGYDTRRLQQIEGTALESLLVNDEVILGQGHGRFMPGETLPSDFLAELSPASWASREAIEKQDALRSRAMQQGCVYMADFSDPSILGLARAAKDSGLTGDTLWQFLREQIYKGVMLHEVGHTVGLRHNFGASADALNFFDEFWPLREQTIFSGDSPDAIVLGSCEYITSDNAAGCEAQATGRMKEYQYTSIMDYGGNFNSDLHGLGRYDVAAIASGYGDLVQVFDPAVTSAMDANSVEMLRTVAEYTNPLFGSVTDYSHYTRLPAMFGGSANIARRNWMHREEWQAQKDTGGPVRVPYVGCYDEYRDSTSTCHVWDTGADAFEITQHYINLHKQYYVFNSFARDRIGFFPGDVLNRVAGRYLLPLTNMYQHALFDLYYASEDPLLQYANIMTMYRAFSHQWNTMASPRYGTYEQNSDGMYEWRSYDWRGTGDLVIEPGQGKRTFSRYDFDSGYNLFNHVLEAGSFYEQIAALIALTTNDASALGVGQDVQADFQTYSIPMYLVFQNEIDQLFSSLILRDSGRYGPRVVGGEVQGYDMLFFEGGLPQTGDPIELDDVFTTRIYTSLYGMALLSSNFDLNFVHKGQVVVEGESEPITVAAGYAVREVTDPLSGRTYQAYYDPAAPESYVGSELLRVTQDLIDEYNAAPAGDAGDETRQQLEWQIGDRVQDAEIMRALYSVFQHNF